MNFEPLKITTGSNQFADLSSNLLSLGLPRLKKTRHIRNFHKFDKKKALKFLRRLLLEFQGNDKVVSYHYS